LSANVVHNIQVTLQTDEVRNIPCGTSGGVVIMFDKIEVVNRLRAEYVIDTIREYSPHYDQLHIFQVGSSTSSCFSIVVG
jgi:hypothetical protein